MKILNKLIQIRIIFYIINFQIYVINCQQDATPMTLGRAFHTATLVWPKIYFLGGYSELSNYTNDFFYLDVSNPVNKTEGFQFVNLAYLTPNTTISGHNRATTSVGGEPRDTIFLFDGHMGNDSYYASGVIFSFNTTEQNWEFVPFNYGGNEPMRRTSMNAATDNNGKTYLFGGAKELEQSPIQYSNLMNTFDTINKFWGDEPIDSTIIPRDGYTATYIPETGYIFYIGGFGKSFYTKELINMETIDIFDTINNRWLHQKTINPPDEGRVFHTAVLTSDRRIVIFGGADNTTKQPVKNYYEVLDVNTCEWYHSNKGIYVETPYKGHTATLINNDYMFISFGYVFTNGGSRLSNDIFIYKIGDYANFTLVDNFPYQSSNTSPVTQTPNNIRTIKIIAIVSCSVGLLLILIAAFIIYKKYPKKRSIQNILLIE
ncbi:hypothetical protein C1645_878202 [Glomus cerebriforme]|uniref:Galactose oxidase n=1 Tax=Glomus cerebriforme TaxID=658196 RepID=A0A397SM23_9GLOM|nr:hypothetical protein C1645_878202 [Glomus cerebriforme]